MAKKNNNNRDIETRVDTSTAENIEVREDPIVNDPSVDTTESEYATPDTTNDVVEEHTESAYTSTGEGWKGERLRDKYDEYHEESESVAAAPKVEKTETKGFEIKIIHYMPNEAAVNEYVQKFVNRTGIKDVTLEESDGGFYLYVVGIPTYEEAVKIKRTIIGKGIKATIVK